MSDEMTPTQNGGFMIDDQYYVAFEDGDFLEVNEETGEISALVRVYNVKNGMDKEVEMDEELSIKVESALSAFFEKAIEDAMNYNKKDTDQSYSPVYDENGIETFEIDVTDNQVD